MATTIEVCIILINLIYPKKKKNCKSDFCSSLDR